MELLSEEDIARRATFPEKADIRFDQMPRNYRGHDDEKYKDKYKGLLGEGCHKVW